MGFTKATLWIGKSYTIKELWCKILGQTWSDGLEEVIWDYANAIIFAAQGRQASYEEIENLITDPISWKHSIQIIKSGGHSFKLVAHDQVDSGYIPDSYFVGLEFSESVLVEDMLDKINLGDFYKGHGFSFYVLQDDCLCCT